MVGFKEGQYRIQPVQEEGKGTRVRARKKKGTAAGGDGSGAATRPASAKWAVKKISKALAELSRALAVAARHIP
jgi:hypothetical protein